MTVAASRPPNPVSHEGRRCWPPRGQATDSESVCLDRIQRTECRLRRSKHRTPTFPLGMAQFGHIGRENCCAVRPLGRPTDC